MVFHTNGQIINPNAPRVGQPVGTAPYGAMFTPQVTFGGLRDRNQRNFAINQPNGGMPMMTIDLACHHVVGWDVIWGFWNKLMTQGHFKTAKTYLGLFNVPQTDLAKLEKQIETNRFVDNWNAEQKLCWNPFNIVRGPNFRSDDPNANATLAGKIDFQMVGKNIYGGRIPPLVAAGRKMVEYIEGGIEKKATDAVDHFKTIRAKGIMEWNEDLWVVDEAFPGYSNTPAPAGGFAVVHPRWRVHSSRTA